MNGCLEQDAIGLDARPLHSCTFGRIEHPVMNCGSVSCPRDDPVECVHFPYKVPLAQAANRWIAGHRSDGIPPKADQRRMRPHARSRRCSFAPCMAPTDYYDIIALHDAGPLRPATGPVNVSRETRRAYRPKTTGIGALRLRWRVTPPRRVSLNREWP